jgi:hypothetical protein
MSVFFTPKHFYSAKQTKQAKEKNLLAEIISDKQIHDGVLLKGIFLYIAEMTDALQVIARQNNSTVLADLLIVAGEEAIAQSRTASSAIASHSS